MIFKDNEHKEFFLRYAIKYKGDPERQALFYTLGISADTRNQIHNLYDFRNECVNPHGIGGWITSGSYRIVRLAFNLFNGSSPIIYRMKDAGADQEDIANEWQMTTPASLYCDGNILYLLEAVKVRYRDYLGVEIDG